jgi:hypothetical protein
MKKQNIRASIKERKLGAVDGRLDRYSIKPSFPNRRAQQRDLVSVADDPKSSAPPKAGC